MNGAAKVGLATTAIAFLVGVWVFLAPFIVGYQDVGQDWIDATKNDMWTGGALIAVSAGALLLFLCFALRDAVRASEHRKAEVRRSEDAGVRREDEPR